MDSGFVTTEIDPDGLAVITFGHPAHNAMPSSLLDQLSDHIQSAGAAASTKLILLKSAGDRTFCAGASFDELLSLTNEAAGKAFFSGFAHVINAIRRSPKIIVCRVQGKAVGGGVGLMAACDYCFASESTAVKLSEISINIGPFVIAPPLERKIGLSAFTMLSLNPTVFFDAHWAQLHGLIHALEPTVNEMDLAIGQFCRPLLSKSQEALTSLKRVLWQNTDHWEVLLYDLAAVSGRLALSEESKRSLREFKQR
ncbi:enoyl-CoA hydratase/isomerase family protein [Parapedobacter sp. 10938]|uniref:enoyl-CoA hydratase/isomerase family protein n=1 Tax=Parapedobacter flavus TaxID=3110225 RepID=UPI002DB8C436|nr:enoyl-CoA hydratase/isomerase family protein [Parapedobacter sp. 10938]MEC3879658.1 enoyl-CoA hydratase/isomerase family protein [Parapedobacter sp. 10938]